MRTSTIGRGRALAEPETAAHRTIVFRTEFNQTHSVPNPYPSSYTVPNPSVGQLHLQYVRVRIQMKLESGKQKLLWVQWSITSETQTQTDALFSVTSQISSARVKTGRFWHRFTIRPAWVVIRAPPERNTGWRRRIARSDTEWHRPHVLRDIWVSQPDGADTLRQPINGFLG